MRTFSVAVLAIWLAVIAVSNATDDYQEKPQDSYVEAKEDKYDDTYKGEDKPDYTPAVKKVKDNYEGTQRALEYSSNETKEKERYSRDNKNTDYNLKANTYRGSYSSSSSESYSRENKRYRGPKRYRNRKGGKKEVRYGRRNYGNPKGKKYGNKYERRRSKYPQQQRGKGKGGKYRIFAESTDDENW